MEWDSRRPQYSDTQRVTEATAMGSVDYPRHFTVLTCMAAVLAIANHGLAGQGLVASFGLFGALHATAMALSVRGTPGRHSRWLFVASGAFLSMLSAASSRVANRSAGEMPVLTSPAVLLGLSSGLGAFGYAILLRTCLGIQVAATEMLGISLGCVAVTWGVFKSGFYLQGGAVCVAVTWWFAFSIGLWLSDRRRASAIRML